MAITKPSPYVPSFLRAALSGSRPLVLSWGDVADTNIASTSSFIYDPHTSPIKSTQQLNVDWSQFQNHTFFMSAEAKVNMAFDNIINGFPFDGARQETEVFFEKLSGFERWVFDSFPRYRGALHFKGNTGGNTSSETGTFIEVQNKTGALFPELSKHASATPVLNPTGSQSLTIEMQLYLPLIGNDDQVVCQMMSGTQQGFSVMLLSASSTSSCQAQFTVVSGSSYLTVPVNLQKGVFNHVAFVLNRDTTVPYLESFVDAASVVESRTQQDLGDLNIDGVTFLIGSGTTVQYGTTTLTPTSTLSGTLDEFRVFHSARTERQQAAYARKSIFSTTELVLYYRFNEPSPPIAGSETDVLNGIVLDSSGYSLHSIVSNFTSSLRINAAEDPLSPMTYEHPDTTVVLFPAYHETVELNQSLLATASLYDQANPNLITKLVPQHYLLEGATQDGFVEPEGLAGQPYAGTGIPGQGQMGNTQIMVSLLYIWARFFDDVKLFVDSFSTLRTVDYETQDTVPDNFLLDIVRSYGFHLPPLFNDATIEQYIRGENVDVDEFTTNEHSLRHVQNMLLRRVLVNLPDVLRSKGTQHSIKSFLRAVGIDPGNNVRIREYGGPTSQQLAFSRESKVEPGAMVKFHTASLVVSPFLTASRVEPGYPWPAGSNDDKLLTSGSWTWEGIVRYTPVDIAMMNSSTQSLVRICATGSVSGSADGSAGILANLIAISSSIDPRLALYVRPGNSSTSPLLKVELAIPSPGIFNYDKWNVSFGCRRNDDDLGSFVSSSYFLRLGYQNAGQIEYLAETSSFLLENPSTQSNAFRRLLASTNASGTFLAMGRGQFIASGSSSQYLNLNNISSVPDEAREVDFVGRLSNVRFWSKYVDQDEWREHIRNPFSVGVKDPLVNWNYVTNRTGSFERLRLSSMIRQDERRAIATSSIGPVGSMSFIDFTENGFHLTGSGFPIEQDIVVGDVFDASYLSPYFDEATSDEKIRIRSYQNQDLVDATPWAGVAPIHEIVASERPTDDVRFTIEFSLIDVLNRDIITMFATMDAIDNALGAPELMFSPDYPDLERLRNIYFNRIKEKLNFQAFFDFFRWFDTSIGTFIQQLIPRKTRFKGTNYTVESHMLERAKQEYHFSEIYLGDSIRQNLNAVILLQQIAGQIKKY
jgi:hypothetical protein